MKRTGLGAVLIAAVAVAGAQAQDSGPSPNASERGWIASCLKKNAQGGAANRACVAIVLEACLGDEDAPKSIKPSDLNAHPRSCAPVEQKIWDEWLNRWYGEALKKIPAAAVDKLRAAQRAWIAYRDAACAVDGALHEFPLGEDNEATCLMTETASRALDMRDLANDDYDSP